MPVPPRPIDSTLHGVTDYTVGTMLMTVFPKLAGIEGTPSSRQIRAAGAIHAGDRLPWVAAEPDGSDNFAPLASLDWQVHV